MPARPVADRFDLAVVDPGHRKEDHDRGAHGDHAPELGIEHQKADQHGADRQRGDQLGQRSRAAAHPDDCQEDQQEGGQAPQHEVGGNGTQNRVVGREVPDWCDVGRRHERVGRDEVVVFKEIAAHLRGEEDYRGEDEQEHRDAHDVVHGVVGVKRNAVKRDAVGIFLCLDLDTVGVVGADLVQRDDVSGDQAEQHQRDRDHMEGEKAVERGITDHIVAANPEREFRADEGDRGKKIHDDLRAPVGHLAPGKQVAEEGFGHQDQKDQAAEDPDQFARLAVGAVNQAPEHVNVDDDEEGRGAGRVHVAHQPAPGHIAHDVFDRLEGLGRVRLVVHREEDAGDNLEHKNQRGQCTKKVEKIEVFGRVVFGEMRLPGRGQRKALVYPAEHTGRVDFLVSRCHVKILDRQAFLSSPISRRVSVR